ncbi:hypothetical protein PG985_002954 [Apiospora marii]|uniref:uncharacterized protein n=1 Tax=Apiospora marii TaxID=335849 RepID=UPI00313166CA
MSRNVRPKAPTTPVKASKKRRGSDSSSSLDLSDEEGGYSGVEAITDSEDEDEDDVVAAEEEQILVNEWRTTAHSSPRPVESDDEGDDEDEDEDEEEENDDDDDSDEDADESSSWEGFMSDGNQDAAAEVPPVKTGSVSDTAVERRVRFDVPDSDGDTTDTDEEHEHGFFPDIFVDQSSLDPSFRREIEQDDPDDSSNSGGFWDIHGPHDGGVDVMGTFGDGDLDYFFEDDSTPVATPGTAHEPSTGVSTPVASPEKFFEDENSLDGYQSDGDTTEDEAPPERPPRRKIHRDQPEEVSDSDATTLIKPRRGQPRVGRFNLESSGKKPVAVVNPRTGKLMIFTPQRLRRLDLSPEQFNFPFYEPLGQSSPLLSNSGNLMMGAMFSSNTFGDFMNTQPVGPMEAFFPHTTDNTAAEEEEEESSDDDLDEDEEEQKLNVDDFVDLGDGSSDDEDVNAVDEGEDLFAATFGRPATANSNSDVTSLLNHFETNSNIVGAFRRDQANSQLIRNGKATRESLAFSSPYFEGTLRGIKDGRLTDTNIPISPLRKHKKKSSVSESPMSGASQKRKASSEQHLGHKRQRSIPDVDLLHI